MADLLTSDSPAWQQDASCRGADSSLFFGPNNFESKRDREVREAAAKEVCRDCVALAACREYALTHDEAFGVWGGLGETERRRAAARTLRRAG